MLTAAFVLLKLNGFETPELFKVRLEKMFEFLQSATMPDGKLPDADDSDTGFVFKMRQEKDVNDRKDLFAVAAAIFGNGTFKAIAGRYSELALLLLGVQGFEEFSAVSESSDIKSAIFRRAGLAFLKTRKDYCSFNFGGAGKQGHNDVLSFTISGKSQFIVDRGAYCNAKDSNLPNELHSLYSYSTAIVDRTAQVDFSESSFIEQDRAARELLNWSLTAEQDIVEAQHHGYERLQQPVVHKRKITFNKHKRTFIIEDNFMGKGRHEIELMFHFAQGVRATDAGRNFLALEGEEFVLLKLQRPFVIENREYSTHDGFQNFAKSALIKINGELPVKMETFIFILSSFDEMNYLLNHIS